MFLKNIGYAALFGAAAFGLVLGSAGTSEAKGKKETMAGAEPMPIVFCLQHSVPVCGVKGGQRFTYDSACFASRDGAKVVSQGACKKAAKKISKKMDKTDKKPTKKM